MQYKGVNVNNQGIEGSAQQIINLTFDFHSIGKGFAQKI